jgi:predicted nucleic acid-binding protein
VALVYFDASALVKVVLDEAGTDVAVDLWDGCDAALSSRLAYPEVCAALAAAARNDDLTTVAARGAFATWDRIWDAVRPVELSKAVERHAGELAPRHALRGANAAHLAGAPAIEGDQLVVAVCPASPCRRGRRATARRPRQPQRMTSPAGTPWWARGDLNPHEETLTGT